MLFHSASPFRNALRITLIYVSFGLLWIAFSDRVLEAMVEDVARLTQLQTYKGWVYVAVTGLLFFILSFGSLRYQKGLTERDSLTQLLNRFMFRDAFEKAIHDARQNKRTLTLALINLDGFRQINQTADQQAGDEILKSVAQLLRHEFDLHGHIGRIAGDEFAVLMQDETCGEDMVPKLQRVQAEVAGLRLPYHPGVSVTARIGVCCFPEDGESVRAMMSQGSLALEEAKIAGQGQLRIYNQAYGEQAQSRNAMLLDLKKAIDDRQLTLVYQPQFDVQWKRLTGVEVLVRWQRNDTFVRPDVFIPLAEQGGFIDRITDFVCQRAITELQREGLLGTSIPRVSINVSARDLENDNSVVRFLERFQNYQGDWSHIQLEITETSVMSSLENVVQNLHQLREKGLQLSVDDFGTGYSSLSVLRRLPVQEIKIDKSFIRDAKTNPSDRMIVRTILAMAKALHLRVVAEGVESTEQVLFLQQENCEQIQGYLMSPPLAISDLVKYISDWQKKPRD